MPVLAAGAGRLPRPAAQVPKQSKAEQQGEYGAINDRLRDIAFDQPQEMDHTQNRDHVHELVQPLPASPP